MCLQLHVGEASFISGVRVGVIHGLRQMPKRPVEIATKQRRQVMMPPWGRLGTRAGSIRSVTSSGDDDGIRVASPLRMLFRLAGCFNQHRFERAAEDCWHRGLITPR